MAALAVITLLLALVLTDSPASAHTRPAIAVRAVPARQTVVRGGRAKWTVTVKNSGNVALSDVHVADPIPGCVKAFKGSLAPGVQRQYWCSAEDVKGHLTNTFSVLGTTRRGAEAKSQAQTDVNIVALVFVKGCASTTAIGQPYTCSYAISTVDPTHDTLTVIGMSDQVRGADGTVTSPGGPSGYLSSLVPTARFKGGASCSDSPVVCKLPFKSTIDFGPTSFYDVSPDDYNLPNHELTDVATVQWQDECNRGTKNCPGPGLTQESSAGSSSVIEQ